MQLVIADKNYSTWSMRPWLLLTAFNIMVKEILESLAPAQGETSIVAKDEAGEKIT